MLTHVSQVVTALESVCRVLCGFRTNYVENNQTDKLEQSFIDLRDPYEVLRIQLVKQHSRGKKAQTTHFQGQAGSATLQ
jgi:hypothetical protein